MSYNQELLEAKLKTYLADQPEEFSVARQPRIHLIHQAMTAGMEEVQVSEIA